MPRSTSGGDKSFAGANSVMDSRDNASGRRVRLKAGIFAVIASIVLCGCATGQAEMDADNIRSLPRPRIGASNSGGETALTREEAIARQKELERERWMNPGPPR
jgi:hypothetical protein